RGALLPHLFTLTAGKGRRRRGSGIARRGPESFFYRDGRTTIPDPGRNDSRPPSPRPVPEAVCFLCHCPSGCPDRALPGALPCGVRTFLPPSRLAALRRGGRLSHCDVPIVPLECRTDRPMGWAGWAYGHIGPTLRSYPSVSWLIWYCSSFLYRLLRGVPITSAVFEMFQPFSRSLPTRNIRSAFSLSSRSVPAFAASLSPAGFGAAGPAPDHAAGDRTVSGRSATSIVSPPVMMIIRSTVFRSSRMLPRKR